LVYTAKILWTGQLHAVGVTTTLDKRSADVGTGSGNILLTSGNSNPGSIIGAGSALIEAVASPSPTSYPSVTFATTSAVADLTATPSPNPSASPQPPAMLLTGPTSGDATSEAGKSVTVTLSAPVSQVVSAGIIVYPTMALNCAQASTGDHIGGVRWTGTAWVDEPNPANADLYWASTSNCVGAYNSGSGAGDLHYPGGGKWFDGSAWFDSVATSDWSNDSTSVSNAQINSTVPGQADNPQYATLVFKTRGGVYAKYRQLQFVPNGVAGPIEVHGQGLDSF
jgi:hypothetical protein